MWGNIDFCIDFTIDLGIDSETAKFDQIWSILIKFDQIALSFVCAMLIDFPQISLLVFYWKSQAPNQ